VTVDTAGTLLDAGDSPDRSLIVNADDFGRSPGVNRGVIRAHEHGIVTSASLMVRWPAATSAARYGRQRPELSVGLHLDLGEWVYRGKHWYAVYEVVPTNEAKAVADEVARQLDAFHSLLGRGPSHLDSHQHVHLQEPVRTIVAQVGNELGVPVRGQSPAIRYSGAFYGQMGKGEPWPDGISLGGLLQILATLPSGVTELGCHPGLEADFDSVYLAERSREVQVLCDPRVRSALRAERVRLRSFAL
jgi:chitin disaccharide deacetylase